MTRRALVAFAIVVSLLIATAPVTASHSTPVVSIHTTDTDFGSATLTNMSVNGSGTSAIVEIASGQSALSEYEGFEDGDISEYGGDTGWYSTVASPTFDGTNALHAPGDTGDEKIISSTTGLPEYPDQGENFTARLRVEDFNNWQAGFIFATQNETSLPGGYTIRLNYGNDEMALYRGDPGGGDAGTVIAGPVSFTSSANEWYEIEVSWGEDGEIIVTLRDEAGSDLAYMSVTDTTWSDGGIGWFAEENGGAGTANYYFDFAQTTESTADLPAEYLNNHSVERSVGGFANVTTANDVSVDLIWRGDSNGDGSYDTLLDQSTGVTSTGNHTGSWSEFAGNDVQINVSVTETGDNPEFNLADEGMEANAAAPEIDNSSASPTGEITTATPTLELDVDDGDFPLVQGDSVDVEFFTNRSGLVGNDTLTSNGTATAMIPAQGGSTKWWAVARDSYGHEVRSANFTFQSPSELRILNESDPDQLVNGTTVELRFFTDELTDSPQIVTRNTTDGTVNMEGLPPDQPFIVVASADGYYDRRIFVPSLFETQEVYLLPTSADGADTIFSIKDYSGDFPQESTVLLVQRPINGTYRTVLGDYFGATGQFPAVLELGTRHRLILMNVETGKTLPLGTYTPLTAATQEVTVSPEGTVEVEETGVTIGIDPATRTLPALPAARIGVDVDGGNATVANWSASATLINDSGATVLWTHNATSAGSVTQELDLTDQGGSQLIVNVSATTTAGGETTKSVTFAISQTFDNDQSLLAVTGRLVDLSPPRHQQDFTTFLAIALTILGMGGVATQLRVSGGTTAFVGLLGITGFAIIGWAPFTLVFVTAVGFVSFAGLRRGL